MEALRITSGLVLTEKELQITTARSSGPGGQNVNKVNSKVRLRWHVEKSQSLTDYQKSRIQEKLSNRITKEGELLISSEKTRDQTKNKEDTIERFRLLLHGVFTRPKVRKKTRVPRSINEKRLKNKKEHSQKKSNRQKKNWMD